MVHQTETDTVRWLFRPRGIAVVSVAFVAAVLLSNLIVRFFNTYVVRFDFPVFWPLGMFLPRQPALYQIAMAVAILALFYLAIRRLQRNAYRLWHVIGVAVALVVVTNLLHGWEEGFVTPLAGGGEEGIQCYHDAMKIESAGEFMRRFEEIQADLLAHSRTHPPGAVLSFYLLHGIVGSPAASAVVIAVFSTVLSLLFLHAILVDEFGAGKLAGYLTFLYALVPSVQVYYAASIDAVIGTVLLGAVYFFTRRRVVMGIIGSFASISLASFLTFGFLFVVPLLIVTEVLRERSVVRSAITLALVAALYVVIDRMLGFNYLASFATASALENPKGFLLFADPASYFFTRLEGVAEIAVFFGPFLTIVALGGLRIMRRSGSRLFTLSVTAVVTVFAMLLTGAFRTGETARCCLFVYPYLLFPVAWYLKRDAGEGREETMLLLVVFAQAVCMQLFGKYFW